MTLRYCQICKKTFQGNTWTLQLNDGKEEKFEVSGHRSCIDELDDKIKSVKDHKNKSTSKILKEINFKL